MRGVVLAIGLVFVAANAANAAVAISSKSTKNMNCSAGTCTATSATAVLNVGDLQTMLASSDVVIRSGGGAANIGITAALSWASASRLTLDADASVNVRAPIVVTGTGGITITTNHAGQGGDFGFDQGGRIAFWDTGSSLIINGDSYVLVSNIAALASAAGSSLHVAFANDYDALPDGTYTAAPVATVFSGTFEGLGNTIDNFRVRIPANSAGNFGLFAQSQGTLRDIALTHVEIAKVGYSGYSTAGALVAVNHGTVTNASASGTQVRSSIAGGLVGNNTGGTVTRSHASIDLPNLHRGRNTQYIGGLVGQNYHGTISQSYATGNVSGSNRSGAGGLVGRNYHGSVLQSYAFGSAQVYQLSLAGGLVGIDRGTISQSYSTGASSGVAAGTNTFGGLIGVQCCHPGFTTSSYWDTTTSGLSFGCGHGDCTGVTGLTDTQLKSGLPAGFDPAVWGSTPSINSGLPYLLDLPPD